jgi:hypothetical protein
MNTINQTIPAAFSPETAFDIALSETVQSSPLPTEALLPLRFLLPSEDEFSRRGIPESALHD